MEMSVRELIEELRKLDGSLAVKIRDVSTDELFDVDSVFESEDDSGRVVVEIQSD